MTNGTPEIWLEYHSAPVRYRQDILRTLEETMVGEITYAVFLAYLNASTHLGEQASALTGMGVLNLRQMSDPLAEEGKWSGGLVVDLPPGELSRNPNMPPHCTAVYIVKRLKNPHTYFYHKTEIWVPFQMEIPQHDWGKDRIRDFQQRGKWWR